MGTGNRGKSKGAVAAYLEFMVFCFFFRLFRLLPLRLVSRISRGLCLLTFHLDGRHRYRAISHLLHAGVAKNHDEAREMAKRNFDHYGTLLAEIVKCDQILASRKDISDTLTLSGSEKARKLFFDPENPSPCIIVTAHYGNWEIAAHAYVELTGRNITSVKRNMKNPLIGRYIFKQRELDSRHEGVEKNGALRHLLRALKEGRSVAILADQHAASSEGVSTRFFGQPARTHFSPALLHLRTGVPIMVGVVRRLPECDFRFEFEMADPIIFTPGDDKERDLAELTQQYTSALEELIRKEPLQWMWVHRRWLNINRKGNMEATIQDMEKMPTELSNLRR